MIQMKLNTNAKIERTERKQYQTIGRQTENASKNTKTCISFWHMDNL